MRNGSLWSNVVFRERSYFPLIWFKDLRLRIWDPEIKYPKAHNFVWQGLFFLSLLSRNFDDQLSSNFHRFVIVCICWDTPSEKTCLWQLPIVSRVFKQLIQLCGWGKKTPENYSRESPCSQVRTEHPICNLKSWLHDKLSCGINWKLVLTVLDFPRSCITEYFFSAACSSGLLNVFCLKRKLHICTNGHFC